MTTGKAPLRVFEDITAGETHQAGPLPVTMDAIVAFARLYDPQPFHLDEAAGAASLLDGIAASGWHTAALGMRLLHDGFVGQIASMGAPGVDELRWLKPVRPGDNLSMILAVEAVRSSASRPDRGFVATSMELRTDAGGTVMTQKFTLMVRRRGAVEKAGAPPAAHPGQTAASTDADVMLTTFYDDVVIGHRSTLGFQPFTPALIIEFAQVYDPQPFHLDAEAAKRTHFGGLCASGWQTAAFWMKHYIAARSRSAAAREASGLPAAVGGPSPGFTDLKWLCPVHVGQTVRYGLTITGKRRVNRSGWGLINTLNTGHLPDGTLAFSFEGRLLWPMAPR